MKSKIITKFPSKRREFLYNWIMWNLLENEETFFVATKVCLFFDHKLLTLVESYPWLPLWRELPGGKISKKDRSNPVLSTLSREVKEELWMSINFTEEDTTLFHIEKRYEQTSLWEQKAFLFLCYIHELQVLPEITLAEHSSYEWISKDQISTFTDWRPGFDDIVRKAFLTVQYNLN